MNTIKLMKTYVSYGHGIICMPEAHISLPFEKRNIEV